MAGPLDGPEDEAADLLGGGPTDGLAAVEVAGVQVPLSRSHGPRNLSQGMATGFA